MAITPIKNAPRTAYVIKGNYKPQSYGQQWAQMASQQKYKLWEEAQKAALQEMRFDEFDYNKKQRLYEIQLQDLNNERDTTKKLIAGYQKELALAGPKTTTRTTDKPEVSRTTVGGGTVSSGDTGSGNLGSAKRDIDRYDREIDQAQLDLNLATQNTGLLSSNEDLRKKAEADVEAAKERKRKAENKKEELMVASGLSEPQPGKTYRTLDQIYGTKSSARAGGGPRTTVTPASTVTSTSVSDKGIDTAVIEEEIRKLQEELKALDEREKALVIPTIQRKNLIEETRRQYGGIQQPPSVYTPSPVTGTTSMPVSADSSKVPSRQERIAELEALGTDEATINEILAQDFGPQRPDLSPLYDGQKFGEAFPTESSLYPIGESGKTSDYIKPITETPYDVRGTAPSRDLVEGNTTFEEVALERGVSPYTPNFPKEPSYIDIAREQGRKAYEEDLVRQAQLEARQNRADMEFLGVPVGDLPEPQVQLPDVGPFAPGERYIDDLGLSAQDSLGVMSQELRGYQPPQTIQELQQKREFLKGPEVPKTIEQPKLPKRIMYKSEVFKKGTTMKKEEVANLLVSDNKPEYVKVVEGLYTIPPNTPQEKRDKLLQNAWDEITLTYSDDRETMKKAHIFLIALDNQMDQKPE